LSGDYQTVILHINVSPKVGDVTRINTRPFSFFTKTTFKVEEEHCVDRAFWRGCCVLGKKNRAASDQKCDRFKPMTGKFKQVSGVKKVIVNLQHLRLI
jgi:hypothetical protein